MLLFLLFTFIFFSILCHVGYKYVFAPLFKVPVSLAGVGAYVMRVEGWSSEAPPTEATKALFGDAKVTLSVVIPAYNEEERIRPMLDEAIQFLQSRPQPFSYEIIIVDDGSKDKTYEAVLADGGLDERRIRYVQLKQNMGKGFAVKVGVLVATGELILMVDADGATKFSDLTSLEEKLEVSDCVFGSRAHLQDEALAKRAWYRNLLMVIFHCFVSFIVGTHIRDTQCGFKLYKRQCAQRIFPSLHIARWAFDIELVVLAEYLSFKTEEVSVNWHEVDGSKLNVAEASIQMVRDIFAIRLLYALKYWRPA